MRIQCIETGKIFPSQKAAAESMGIQPAIISRQINGKRRKASGYTFKRVYLDSEEQSKNSPGRKNA